MSSLPQEYVRRVVETLANFEDDLIASNGFFAREEHLENCIEGVRSEFETDRRAVAVFAVPDAVSTLISTLCRAEEPRLENAPAERRRFENAFAATVLLSSGIGVRGLKRNPPLLEQLWDFIEQPGHHPVLLHYWARCAGALLLSSDRADGLRTCIAVLGLGRLLLPLIRLVHCEAICMLLKTVIGLDELGSQAQETDADAQNSIDLRVAITGDHSVVSCMLDQMAEGAEAASTAADFLSAVMDAIVDRPDGAELLGIIAHEFVPRCARVVGKGPCARSDARESQAAFLKLCAAVVRAEYVCLAERTEQRSHLPAELLGSPLSPAPVTARPVCEAAANLLADLVPLLFHGGAVVSQAAICLWSTLLEVGRESDIGSAASCALATIAVDLFTATDRNGGGRQDFLRHELSNALTAGLRADQAELSTTILCEAELIEKLELNLRMREGAGGKASPCSPEHAKLLLVELSTMVEQPTVAPLLMRSPAWHRALLLAGLPAHFIAGADADADEYATEECRSGTAGCEERPPQLDDAPIVGDEDGASLTCVRGDTTKNMENLDPNHPVKAGSGVCSPTKVAVHIVSDTSPCPRAGGKASDVLVIDNNSLRNPDDFSKLTPRPTFERRSVLHRKAKESSPYYRQDETQEPEVADGCATIDALNETVKALHF